MSLGRAGQALGLTLVLALGSEALCRGGPPDASRRLGLEPPRHILQGRICTWGVAWRIAVSTMTPSAGKLRTFPKTSLYFLPLFFFFESSKKKAPFPLSALSAIICYLLSLSCFIVSWFIFVKVFTRGLLSSPSNTDPHCLLSILGRCALGIEF